MKPFNPLQFFAWQCLGGFLGAIALPLLVVGYVTATTPKAWDDGQGGMLILFPIPTGIVLGATMAAVLCLKHANRDGSASRVLISVGAVLTILALIEAFIAHDWFRLLLPYYGWSGLWGIALLFIGIFGLWRRAKAVQ